MYECACKSQETTIITMKDIVEIYNSKINYIRSTNQDMQNYIDICLRELERRADYPEHSTAHFENVANITVNSASVIHQEKNGSKANPYEKNEANKSIDENASHKIYFKSYLDNLIQDANLMTTSLGKL